MSTTAVSDAAMVPSNQRPIPLRGRPDLVIAVNSFQGARYWVIKDPVALKYHRLRAEQYRVLRLLDGRRSLEQIRDDLLLEMPTLQLSLVDVQNLIADLHQKGLVHSDRPGQAGELISKHRKQRREKLFGLFKSLLYLRLPGWDPERTLSAMYPWFRWMFHPVAVAACGLLVALSLLLLATDFESFRSRLPEFDQFFGWPNLIYLWGTLAVAKVIHEFGHGLSCKHFGGECHEMGVMLLVFSPCLYCDVSDSWMLRSKWQRILIAAAGMYIEIVMSAVAVLVWWNTQPGLLHHLAMNVFFVTTVTTVIFNANPLMRFDGYYMLSDFLEIPNLRPKADKMLRESFAWHCLGIEPRPDPFMPETGKVWFVLFAIAAWLYRWVILFGITTFLYTVLKPYKLQSIGIALAVLSIGGIFASMVTNVYRVVSAPREEPMSRFKIALTLLILSGVTGLMLSMPIPWHLESAFLIEPMQVRRVYNNTAGFLVEFQRQPGERVEAGTVLAVLSNPDLEDERRRIENQIAIQRVEIDVQRALDAVEQHLVALQKLDSLQQQLVEVNRQIDDLRVVAPCAGTIIAAPQVPEPDSDRENQVLPTWSGAPTDARNKGAFLEERTHLLSVAPASTMEAVMLVDQGDRNFIRPGTPVELKLEHLPDRTYAADVREISHRHVEFAPDALSNKLGGSLSTVTDEQGRERLTSPAYQATVTLPEDEQLMVPGLRGKARFLVDERTAGEWLWRYFRQTFHFRM